ncbi:MAG: hypothetical protein V1782_04630, partial [Pseudomonadota bacterium]
GEEMKKIVIVFAICLVASNAFAKAPKKPISEPQSPKQESLKVTWADEPTSILGIKFGAPIADSAEECPMIGSHYGFPKTGGDPCWAPEKNLKDYYKIQIGKSIGVMITDISAFQLDGQVEYVSFKFRSYDSQNLSDLLKAKYGAPKSEKAGQIQNKMGATFDQLTMYWEGENVSILFQSRAGKIDEGRVDVSTKKHKQHLEAVSSNIIKMKDNL